MRFLVVMKYPGFLRYFDSTIAELAARGHSVDVAFGSTSKQAEGLEALHGAGDRVRVIGEVPVRRDDWRPVAQFLARTADYVRYLDPRLAGASYLRRRAAKTLPPSATFLVRIPTLPGWVVSLLTRVLRGAFSALSDDRRVTDFVRAARPDVVVLTSLVDHEAQPELARSARAIGVPVVMAVASWDNLTTRGLVRPRPDRTTVWNDIQRGEAAELHGLNASSVEVTGAQPFDRWFGREPTRDRIAFCRRVGLPDDRPFVLFVGSTASISAPGLEQLFVRRWATALRAGDASAASGLSVLVRPHPYNLAGWDAVNLSDLGPVRVWPRGEANPVNEGDRADYFDSLFHCAAVVGINTSAMIEAAIVGRPVLTVRTPEFADTQDATVHFHYLEPEHGGFLRVSTSLDEHLVQLRDVLDHPDAAARELRSFVSSFIRPRGLDRPATSILADALESARSISPTRPARVREALVRGVLWVAGPRRTVARRARRALSKRWKRSPRRRAARRAHRRARRLLVRRSR